MNSWDLVLDLVATLAGAFILGAMMERIRQSAVLGYILAGVILGPGALRVVRELDAVAAIAELGVALLLFTIGLECSWRQLRNLGRLAFAGGSLQILLTGGVAYAVAAPILGDSKQSLAMASVIALSSTAVVLKILKERGDLDASHGKAALGILLAQDLALIPLVALLSTVSSEVPRSGSLSELGSVVSQVALLIIGIVILASLFLPRLLSSRTLSRNRELPILLAITTCMGASWASHLAGVTPALGAFVAGMVLAETSFADQIRSDVAPLRTLFATVFFASIGMLADVGWIVSHWGETLVVTAAIVVGKTVTGFASVRILGMTTIASLATGLALAQVGELSFVLLQLGRSRGIVSADAGQLLTSAIVLSLAVCPYLVAGAPGIARALARRVLPQRTLKREERFETVQAARLVGHTIVAGYGEAGRAAAGALADAGCTVLVVDASAPALAEARRAGYQVRQGDATHREILERAAIDRASGVVVAVSDHRSARMVVSLARGMAPGVAIVARARYHLFAPDIRQAGANIVVDEESLVGWRLGEEMLVQLGLHWDSIGEGLYHPELGGERH